MTSKFVRGNPLLRLYLSTGNPTEVERPALLVELCREYAEDNNKEGFLAIFELLWGAVAETKPGVTSSIDDCITSQKSFVVRFEDPAVKGEVSLLAWEYSYHLTMLSLELDKILSKKVLGHDIYTTVYKERFLTAHVQNDRTQAGNLFQSILEGFIRTEQSIGTVEPDTIDSVLRMSLQASPPLRSSHLMEYLQRVVNVAKTDVSFLDPVARTIGINLLKSMHLDEVVEKFFPQKEATAPT